MFNTSLFAVLFVACMPGAANARPRKSPRDALLDVTTFLPPHTTPKGCFTAGQHLEIGGRVQELGSGWCRICTCTQQGLSCMIGDCVAPMCVDYVRSGCCYHCPNGQNCRLPSGEVISGAVERDGMLCECPKTLSSIPGAPSDRYTTAICTLL